MMRDKTRRAVYTVAGGAVVMLALVVGLLGVRAEGQRSSSSGDDKDSKTALTAEQVISSVRTAVAAKPGNVLAVEAELEAGKTVCEVEVLAQEDGKTYEVEVDVATNTVIEIEVDEED